MRTMEKTVRRSEGMRETRRKREKEYEEKTLMAASPKERERQKRGRKEEMQEYLPSCSP